ncbi:MAG: VanZ family protein [Gammaproteobacteria bacterium]
MNWLLDSPRAWRAVGWCGVFAICVLSLSPPSRLLTEAPRHADKLYHLFAYASVAWWLALGYPRGRIPALALALVLIGAGIEVLQGFTGTRASSAWDALANTLGVILGCSLVARTPAGFPAFRRAQ